jgi:hypothetical protein
VANGACAQTCTNRDGSYACGCGGDAGCNEGNTNITINNGCKWEASNCFGQAMEGPRFLWVYVKY